MDWNAAIERNREALKRVLASLVAMAGLGGTAAFTSPLWGGRRLSDRRVGVAIGLQPPPDASPPPSHKGEVNPGHPTLPRHLHRAVLRLLRPAEAAARRLVIVAARGLPATPPARKGEVVDLPPARPRKPKPKPTILRNGIGTGIVMPRHIFAAPPLTPLHKGEGLVHVAPGLAADVVGASALESSSPLWRGASGRGKVASARTPGFQLFDPVRRPSRPRRPNGVPRISFPGLAEPSPVPVRRPLSPQDPIDATRLARRLATLALVLDDLPREARRFARWRCRVAAGAQDKEPGDRTDPPLRSGGGGSRRARTPRVWPLRLGRPPGQRSVGSRWPAHEVHEVLSDMQCFANEALERPDTS